MTKHTLIFKIKEKYIINLYFQLEFYEIEIQNR